MSCGRNNVDAGPGMRAAVVPDGVVVFDKRKTAAAGAQEHTDLLTLFPKRDRLR
jgi:hypothetical protein